MIAKLIDSIARFQFWLATKKLKQDKDFKYLTEYDDCLAVEILRGKYAGVKVKYDNLRIKEDVYGAVLEFDTFIIENPSNINLDTKKFARLASFIIRLMLIQSVKAENESRERDSVEPDEERTIREEDPPVRKARVSNRKPRKKTVRGDL